MPNDCSATFTDAAIANYATHDQRAPARDMIVMWDAGTIEVNRMWAERAGRRMGWNVAMLISEIMFWCRGLVWLQPGGRGILFHIGGITLDQSAASIQVMWSLSTNQRAGHLVWGEEHHPRGRDIYTLVSVTALDQSEAWTRGGDQWEASTRPYNDWAVHKNIKPMKSSDSPVSTVIWNDDKTLFTRLLSY